MVRLPEKLGPGRLRRAALMWGLPTVASVLYAVLERTVFWTEVATIAASIWGALLPGARVEMPSTPVAVERLESGSTQRVHTFTSDGALSCTGGSITAGTSTGCTGGTVTTVYGGGGGGGGGVTSVTGGSGGGGGGSGSGSSGQVIIQYYGGVR